MTPARFAFLGSKHLGVRVLTAALETAGDQLVGALGLTDHTDQRSAFDELRLVARASGKAFRAVSSTRDVVEALERWQPDVVIVCGWYQVLPVTHLAPIRFYGFHGSLLPRYRGNAPLVWQVINGEARAGVSFFELVDALDEGPIVGQTPFDISVDDSIGDVLGRAAAASEDLVKSHLLPLLLGRAEHRGQDQTLATYCGGRIADDGLIDWSWTSVRIHNFIRAQAHPYPGAFTRLRGGDRVHIWRTRLDNRKFTAVAGSVVERLASEFVVGTGDGVIRVVEYSTDSDRPIRSIRTRFE